MFDEKEWTLGKKVLLGFIIFFFLTFIITSFFGRRGVMEIFKYKDEIMQLEKEISQLKKVKKGLEVEIKELENNNMAVEPIARKELWYKKKGEKVIIFDEKGKNEK
jgi:cell division protein FtsB